MLGEFSVRNGDTNVATFALNGNLGPIRFANARRDFGQGHPNDLVIVKDNSELIVVPVHGSYSIGFRVL